MIHGSCLISFMAMMALRIDPPTLQQRSNMQRPGIQSWNRSCIAPILRVESLADFIATVTVHSKCKALFWLCCKDFAQKTRKELNRLKRVQPAGSSLYSSACFSFAVRVPTHLGITLECCMLFCQFLFLDSPMRPEVMNITSLKSHLFGLQR